jgi:transcriptional regulator NrdR family protein
MIACPICGGKTMVAETRDVGAQTRRRRRCVRVSCGGKLTTVEVVVRVRQGSHALADLVLVSSSQIAQLRALVAAMFGGVP